MKLYHFLLLQALKLDKCKFKKNKTRVAYVGKYNEFEIRRCDLYESTVELTS